MMWQLSTCLPLKDPKFPNSEVVFISLSSSDTSQLQSPLCTKTSKTAPIEMKRKKWSELEEQTLLTKYSELMSSGTLSKLKTREKKFRPIADHVNAVHHLQDPVSFPFKWSWRDVSIKVQNMRHQYLGVKQKIRTSKNEFNWKDGENHWENFLKYKEVFGDVELEVKNKKLSDGCGTDFFKDCGDLNFGIDSEDLEEEEEDDDDDAEEEEDEEEEEEGDNGDDDNNAGEEDGKFAREKSNGEMNGDQKEKVKKGFGRKRRLGLLGAQVIELRDMVTRTEYKRREWNFNRDKCMLEREEKRRELEFKRKMRQNEEEEKAENWEMELEARELMLTRREFERRLRVEKELDEERRKRRIIEEKLEEEEMEWRERIVGMQIEHEKEMMQMHADACQNQIQIMGIFARIICQFFGSANDGLGGGLAGLPPQVLHNLQHPGGLGDGGKPDSNSPSEFI